MDIYTRKSRWKIYLSILALAIITISMIYTNYLASMLAKEEQNKVEQWILAQELLTDTDNEDFENCDFTLHHEILSANKTIPVILVNERGIPLEGINFGDLENRDTAFLRQELEDMVAEGMEPLKGDYQQLYYRNSILLRLLTYFPLFQFFLITVFIGFGYLGFNISRRAEQNRVWAGLAKETAHQLGTPISAIMGWIEHLREMKSDDGETLEILDELDKDIKRLDLVADRFSKIGSEPELKETNIYTQLEQCRQYMARRAPRKVSFEFPDPESIPKYVQINAPLFDWVIENLLRNALDSMGGRGEISAEVSEDNDYIIINVSDTGKGIPANKFKTIFEPGFTTKKRGWGLGLSLSKRIIESYHSGRIFVKNSILNEGTTFSVKLPKEIIK